MPLRRIRERVQPPEHRRRDRELEFGQVIAEPCLGEVGEDVEFAPYVSCRSAACAADGFAIDEPHDSIRNVNLGEIAGNHRASVRLNLSTRGLDLLPANVLSRSPSHEPRRLGIELRQDIVGEAARMLDRAAPEEDFVLGLRSAPPHRFTPRDVAQRAETIGRAMTLHRSRRAIASAERAARRSGEGSAPPISSTVIHPQNVPSLRP